MALMFKGEVDFKVNATDPPIVLRLSIGGLEWIDQECGGLNALMARCSAGEITLKDVVNVVAAGLNPEKPGDAIEQSRGLVAAAGFVAVLDAALRLLRIGMSPQSGNAPATGNGASPVASLSDASSA